jgi:peroxidase
MIHMIPWLSQVHIWYHKLCVCVFGRCWTCSCCSQITCFQAQLHDQNGKGQLDSYLETSCLHKLQHLSPAQNGDSNQTTNLDLCTPTSFDSQYYKNLQAQNGLLFPNEVFTTPGDSRSLINLYANSQEAFFNYSTTSMLKMGRTKVLTGNEGQVHTNCRIVNVEH